MCSRDIGVIDFIVNRNFVDFCSWKRLLGNQTFNYLKGYWFKITLNKKFK